MSFIFTVDQFSEKLLINNDFNNVKCCGDTRYDQVSNGLNKNLNLIINNHV